jgi:hypothetical protein
MRCEKCGTMLDKEEAGRKGGEVGGTLLFVATSEWLKGRAGIVFPRRQVTRGEYERAKTVIEEIFGDVP